MSGGAWTHIIYLIASTLFIFGIKLLSSPKTARKGNLYGAAGMLLAIIVTLLSREIVSFTAILLGILIGSAIGVLAAVKVPMTAMPQMVAIFNGFGGGASAIVAAVELLRATGLGSVPVEVSLPGVAGLFIGGITFSGSLIAFGKLQELFYSGPILLPARHLVNATIFVVVLIMSVAMVVGNTAPALLWGTILLSLLLGILLVIPIGGADMPIVISLLNSYSGLAGSAAGFVIGNNLLIITGALVGASGIILTNIMCRAMNRSLASVVLGGFGVGAGATVATGGTVRSVEADEAAIILGYAQSVIFVPGYGLAVAQAQHQLRELADLLQARGAKVSYAIHPVAGRMPGHMNVLLAEANVPYDQLFDLDQINGEFPHTDVAVVIGANDVVNPSARTDPHSPIYGMPILNVDQAKTVIVLKRSMSPGFAGIDNPLFYLENTVMLFGDAKDSLLKLIEEVKQL